MSIALDVALLATAATHVLLAPYNKVEESFGTHATHDVLMYGVSPAAIPNFDHNVFPGAVPRTFVGAVILGWTSAPVIHFANSLGLVTTKFDLQVIVRLVLATLNALGLCLLRRAISKRFGRLTGALFTLFTISQFHLPFWMGRLIPNMFALLPVNISLYLLVNRAPNALRPSVSSVRTAMTLLAFTAVVFRSEVAMLLASFALHALLSGYIKFFDLLRTGLVVGVASIGITTLVDSYFWQQWPLWPEFAGLYFNVYEGKSSDWGVSPAHAYFTSHLPKLLLTSLPLSCLGAILDSRIRSILLPALGFVTLISALGHKEWRFIIYVVPMFNIAAARAARWMAGQRKSSIFGRLWLFAVVGALLVNTAAMILFTRSSIANYPGGEILMRFNQYYANRTNVHLHIDNLAAQTGASLFLQLNQPPFYHIMPLSSSPNWVYNKTEHQTPTLLAVNTDITHIITERPDDFSTEKWRVVFSVDGFDRWNLGRRRMQQGAQDLFGLDFGVQMVSSGKLWVFERIQTGGLFS